MTAVKRSLVLSFLSVAALLAGTSARAEDTSAPRTVHFRVTVTNVTAGNALSPFLAVVGTSAFRLFAVAQPASAGIAAIAETGNTAPLEAELVGNPAVLTKAKAAGGPVPAAGTATAEFDVDADAIRCGATLSVAAMIGKSNDSFIALRGVSLADVAARHTVALNATNFDAGSEENTGNVEDFGAGGHPTANAEGHISYDRGLNPRGNAGDLIAWGSVAATVVIERL